MPEPSPLPAALITDPPLHTRDLSVLLARIADLADEQGVDLETATSMAMADALPDDTPAARFRVEDTGAAEWAMRVLREADEHLADVQAQADQWHREVQAWADREATPALRSRVYMDALLRDYGARRRAEDPDVATLRLPSGVIETTARRATPRVADPDAVLAWAKANAPLAVETVPATERVTAAAAKALGKIVEDRREEDDGTEVVVRSFVAEGGEPIPGMEVVPPTLDVRVKPGPT